MTGQDADLAACQRIVRGTQIDVGVQAAREARRPGRGGRGGDSPGTSRSSLAEGVSNGVREVPSILEPVIVVDRDNLDATVVRDGFHRAEDLKR